MGTNWSMCTEPGTVPPLKPSLEATASLWMEPSAAWKPLWGLRKAPVSRSDASVSVIVYPPVDANSGRAHHFEIAPIERLFPAFAKPLKARTGDRGRAGLRRVAPRRGRCGALDSVF